MEIITINKDNIDSEHICCAIGNDHANKCRAQTKKDWLMNQFDLGLVFKRLDARGKVFIEYMPIEHVWKPICGKNYMAINCLWVSGQFKGQGHSSRLLDECIKDSLALGKDGIAVVSSNKVKPFLTDKKFFLKKGFQVVDSALPYFELLALKFNPAAGNPGFTDKAKGALCDNANGFTFIYSNQCVFMEEYVHLLNETAMESGIPSQTIKLTSSNQAQTMGSPFGTLGIYYEGQFVTHELMTKDKFKKLIEEIK